MIFRATTSTKEYKAAMGKLTKEQLPRVRVAAINVIARTVHSASERNLGQRMTLRNKYTVKSLRFSPAKVRSGGRVGYAETGTVSPYLPIQETGGTVRAKRRKLAIPTLAARIGKSKQRVIASKMRMNKLGALNAKGGKFFYAPFHKPGIFYRPSKKRLVMVRDLSERSIRVKPTHWHTDAVKKFGTQHLMEAVFAREARKIIGAKQ